VPDNVFEQLTPSEQAWLRERLESVSKHIPIGAQERTRGIGVATIFLESHIGHVASTVVGIAQEKNVENIVVGNRGVKSIAALFLGSLSQKFVNVAPKPVTVVP
jgi:nucleotide-binding universal stress UspA family protein